MTRIYPSSSCYSATLRLYAVKRCCNVFLFWSAVAVAFFMAGLFGQLSVFLGL